MERHPLFSIIIPTYNRPKQLVTCLNSIVSQKTEHHFEVIVVDDGSDQNILQIISEAGLDTKCSLIKQINKGPAAARNNGADHAKGDYLIFLDDDCTLPQDWVQTISPHLNGAVMVGGHSINKIQNSIFSASSQLLIDYIYNYYNKDPLQAKFITSNNMIVPKNVFHEIGGFSTRFKKAAAEDRDFCDKWISRGLKIHYVPSIKIEHYHKMNFKQFCRQHYNYGFGAKFYHDERRERGKQSIPIEPLKFYFDLIAYPLKKGKSLDALLQSACLILSQLCNSLGYVKAKNLRMN